MNIKIIIPKVPALAVNMLISGGFEAGVVGGCTRDAILGIKPNDWDVCTSATPKEIQEVFKDYRQLDVGIKHGTITIIFDKEAIEITTYRIDGTYADGRRPDNVIFTKNLVEDLRRRDYTINAIFYNDKTGIIDPFFGITDIKNKLIRCVGNPELRLKEDSLRILRGIRFSSCLGFKIEENTRKAIFKYKQLLNKVSIERVTSEFVKTINGKFAGNIICEYKEIFNFILPEAELALKNCITITQNIKSTDDLIIKMAVFFYYISKTSNVAEIFKRIKITSADYLTPDDSKDILELIRYSDLRIRTNKIEIKKLLSKFNGNILLFEKFIEFKKIIDNYSDEDFKKIKFYYVQIIQNNECITLKNLAVNGEDLIAIGIKPGKELGLILNKIFDYVINEKLPNNKKDIIYYLKNNPIQ